MKVFWTISTHWDREWYKPFQSFRYDLVKVTDHIIENLENGKIDVFTFDGQTIVLEDYLEIKPDQREKLAELIKSGKIKVGPWYIMPDELLVSGESLIKNFLVGKAEAEKYEAEAWKYGYMNDIFGHIAQMPQILNGFGIKCVYLGRGLGDKDKSFRNFLWKAPDGSECFGYNQQYATLYRKFNQEEDKEASIEEFLKENEDKTGLTILLYTDDHADVSSNTSEFLKAKDNLSNKYEMIEGLENIISEAEKIKDSLPCVTGELITTGKTPEHFRAVTHSISSYYPLKYENDVCENLLENKLSPMLVMAKLMGIELNPAFYQLACKYLLKNQPHDSICGCSIDVVHDDMAYRYSQVKSIASAMRSDFEDRISGKREKEYCISVMNYSAKKYQGLFFTELLFDEEWENKLTDNARYQQYYAFDILDENGNCVPYQLMGIEKNCYNSNKPYEPGRDKYVVAICGELKAFGKTVFNIVPKKPSICVKTLSDGELTAENKYLKLQITTDGSVTIFDKQTGKEYKGLNTFTDDGEIGNGWFSERPLSENRIVSSKGSQTTVEILRNGPLVTTFRVTKYLNVPKQADYSALTRADEYSVLKIVSDITLKKDSKAVEFETVVDNRIKDHRLRMEFPTEIEGESYFASQAFTFVKRNRAITNDGANFAEPEAYEKNTSGIICVKDNNKESGLSFVSKAGIHECGVSKSGVICVTMLRSFGRIMWGNIPNEKAQLQGTHTFRYALTTETDFAALDDMKKNMFETYSNVIAEKGCYSSSLFEVSGKVCVSIVKPSENGKGIVLRVYNPKETSEQCTLLMKTNIRKLSKANLAEQEISQLQLENNSISFEISPNKIETFYMEI